ncbi:tagatose-6-phosphate ketose isomerase [Actinoplanes philippinensis]|uniref:Tagatose-6-phosphate ketose/aldose isomerase n=1 Tax=Actinoplanes philippinensis TaxID=35752 RepID=A0A1I2I517_9ACTN|nr:SIS domain-containing protein [Actinoplanes philippinensis]GIE78596.1 tagatose-6-phosphate ketose isomerase [Actinoplanes philippinensis]SFF37559.1 tagatose-6-phosphate ketose/aldose isomerase [Actinoplanes philippinensis]
MTDSDFTRAEIEQQPSVWQATRRLVTAARTRLDDVLGPALRDPATRVVLTGAGTSAYAGQVLAPELTRLLDRPVEAVPTTDIVTDPQTLTAGNRPVLLVSFARSGNSPESVAAAALLDRLHPAARHLLITCNADGDLVRRYAHAANAVVITLPPATNDRGFAMTSSFTSMILAAHLCLAGDVDVDALARAAAAVLADTTGIEKTVTASRPDRLVYLGSGSLTGLAREAALKCLELTAGDVAAWGESTLAFRHGPKAALTPGTLAAIFVSGDAYRRAYDLDLARELIGSLGADRVVLIGDSTHGLDTLHWHVPREPGLPDAVWAAAAIIPAQLAALACSLALGHTPDNPFPGGEVNRVVRGVVIHPFGERRD